MKKALAATVVVGTVLVTGCSTAPVASTAPPPATSASEPDGLSTAEACTEVSETFQRASKTRDEAQAQAQQRKESAKSARESRLSYAMAVQAAEAFEYRMTQLYASLWPQVADADMKDVLRALSRDLYDEPTIAALNGMCINP